MHYIWFKTSNILEKELSLNRVVVVTVYDSFPASETGRHAVSDRTMNSALYQRITSHQFVTQSSGTVRLFSWKSTLND